jgi:hypothetical protein
MLAGALDHEKMALLDSGTGPNRLSHIRDKRADASNKSQLFSAMTKSILCWHRVCATHENGDIAAAEHATRIAR